MRHFNNILVTGGCGFIGSNFIISLFNNPYFSGNIINVDCLTYAANPLYLNETIKKFKDRYFFEKIDIREKDKIKHIFKKYNIDCVVHFAAESHVDNSIKNPDNFITTNINGTMNILEVAKNYWRNNNSNNLFHYISTDEVYGSLNENGFFYESSPLNPKSPYSASKASAEMLCLAYYNTYKFPVTISNCSNNFGPNQHKEKLIPHVIESILKNKPIEIYGNGQNIRDWIYVEDHNIGVQNIIFNGKCGEKYNIGGDNELSNLNLVNIIIDKIYKKINKEKNEILKLITFVQDRPGHDFRYAINHDKITKELKWQNSVSFESAIIKTIDWYINLFSYTF